MVIISFLQPQLPTQLFHLAFFVSSWRGTWTCNPQLPFLFFGFFLFLSIYIYPYLFQGPRLNFWEPLLLYLNYLSAKIKLFGQTSFSILQLKIEIWHDPVWTVESSTKFVIRSSIFEVFHTPLISWKYGIFVVTKQSIFGFSIINHEIWNLLL